MRAHSTQQKDAKIASIILLRVILRPIRRNFPFTFLQEAFRAMSSNFSTFENGTSKRYASSSLNFKFKAEKRKRTEREIVLVSDLALPVQLSLWLFIDRQTMSISPSLFLIQRSKF